MSNKERRGSDPSPLIKKPSKIQQDMLRLPTFKDGQIMNEIKEDMNESSLKTDSDYM
jgi:hypothetical protein